MSIYKNVLKESSFLSSNAKIDFPETQIKDKNIQEIESSFSSKIDTDLDIKGLFNSDIQSLLTEKQNLLIKIKEIEETFEGIDSENNAKRISELNGKQAKLNGELVHLKSKIDSIEEELNKVRFEIRNLSSRGIERILEAIKKQRWYFFKNRPKVLMDRDTGLLWANLDYFSFFKGDNPDQKYVWNEGINSFHKLVIDGYKNWDLPTELQFSKMYNDKSFPFITDRYLIKGRQFWRLKNSSTSSPSVGLFSDGIKFNSWDSYWLPCSTSITYEDYEKNISPSNKVYSEQERLRFTLELFVKNGLQPIFKEDDITKLYHQIYFEKPALIHKLNKLETHLNSLQQVELLSSSFDYQSILLKYEWKAIEGSIIKYYESVKSVMDEFMEKLEYYEEVKEDIIRDFHVIGLKLTKKYEHNPNLTEEENHLLKARQSFFKKNFELGMNHVNAKLLSMKSQAEKMEKRIEIINDGDNALQQLSKIENEERASFSFIVENAAKIIKDALVKIEFFEANRPFVISAVFLWEKWTEDYQIFKTTLKDQLKHKAEDDGIESEVYRAWYEDWQKKRMKIEERFLPLIQRGLKDSLLEFTDDGTTVIERVLQLLKEYKDEINKFYLEERKSIYIENALNIGGDLQEKLVTESKLYKLTAHFQRELQTIIFKIEKSEDRLFLLRWAVVLIDLQIDEVLSFIQNQELTNISLEVLNEFADLKQKNFDIYISDSQAFTEELQRREKEYNSLIFRMRKDLMKR
ncbi:hypothetical protein V7161_19620 [Neobacillus drentensis]|uniref:hypothetical protein n=1 Tax=Neobacillus drentensis TaxID=220684 RepID=UPI00300312D2